MSASAQRNYRPETQLVHAGTLRSQFGETSEALFLTQGYVYDSALTRNDASRTKSRATSIPAFPTQP
jgi:cystathionine beta-lyase/cystathionine gamma-synthase